MNKVSKSPRSVCALLYIMIFLFVTGCGGGGSSTPPGNNGTPVVTITQPPISQTVTQPAPASFSVQASATNNGVLHYQWVSQSGSSSTNVGSDSPDYIIEPTAVSMTGTKVSVVVTASSDPVQSTPATLTVVAPSGSGDAVAPNLVQVKSSSCEPTNSATCVPGPASQTTINNTAGDSLYVFVVVNYFQTPGITTVQTPQLQDTNGNPVPSPGALQLDQTTPEDSPCISIPSGGYLPGGWCIYLASELNAAPGQHLFSLVQGAQLFDQYSIVTLEFHGVTHGIDATVFGTGFNGAPSSAPVTVGSLTTNLPNETIFAVGAFSAPLLSGAGFNQVWTGPGPNAEITIETMTAPTAGSYDIVFFGTGPVGGNAFSIY